MKAVNENEYDIIQAASKMNVDSQCDFRDILKKLERQEQYIYWLQPKLGKVQDQVPAINVNNCFYHLNLKMEKAAFRNVRLHRNFCNLEMLQNGLPKLRIPSRLLREKRRTSTRVSVSKNAMIFF